MCTWLVACCFSRIYFFSSLLLTHLKNPHTNFIKRNLNLYFCFVDCLGYDCCDEYQRYYSYSFSFHSFFPLFFFFFISFLLLCFFRVVGSVFGSFSYIDIFSQGLGLGFGCKRPGVPHQIKFYYLLNGTFIFHPVSNLS